MRSATYKNEASQEKQLVSKIICPNCWHRFPPEDVLFIAKHPELIGDPIAGDNEFLRFLPNHFTAKGDAMDYRGLTTTDLACPECHLQVPEAMLEITPLFISLIGAPASGKSYFLTTMVWELRQLMPKLQLMFSDADPVANSVIHEYEQTLFMNSNMDIPTEIPKTQTDDPRLYRTVLQDGASVRCPRPLQFIMWPMSNHPRHSKANKTGRIVVFYDNAGEDYLPQVEDSSSVVVQHLAKSQILMMFFDPTQDTRLSTQCGSEGASESGGLSPQRGQHSMILRQETLLREAAVRIRRYLGLSENTGIKTPLLIIVPKFDVWAKDAGISIDDEPFVSTEQEDSLCMDLEKVEQNSRILRKVFQKLCPEFVSVAEHLTETVRFIPVTSLGCSPELVKSDGRQYYGIRPNRVNPKWVTVPLLYALCKWASGLIPKVNHTTDN